MSSAKKIKSDSTKSDENVNGDADLKEFDFTQKSSWSDVQLEIESKTLYAPRSFLAMISPVFRRMFQSNFKEKEATSIKLPNKKYEDVLTFLQCTIPWSSVKVTYYNIRQILPLAHEYQVKGLLKDCCVCLLATLGSPSSYWLSADECCKICLLADTYSLNDVMERCIVSFTSMTSDQYRDLEIFNIIPADIRYKILYDQIHRHLREL